LTALGGEATANKSTTTTLGTSDTLFPTQKAVKTYVDAADVVVAAAASAESTSTLATATGRIPSTAYGVSIWSWDPGHPTWIGYSIREVNLTYSGTPTNLRVTNLTGYVIGGNTGLDGLDTGTLASDTWYYLWAICKVDGTLPGLMLSLSNSSPTMPSGYTHKRLVGIVTTIPGTAQFTSYRQEGNRIWYVVPVSVLSGGTQESFTLVDLSAWVPAIAISVHLKASLAAGTADSAEMLLSPNASDVTHGTAALYTVFNGYGNWESVIYVAQSTYYKIVNYGTCVGSGSLSVLGYTININ
jgi:hypothetical protein